MARSARNTPGTHMISARLNSIDNALRLTHTYVLLHVDVLHILTQTNAYPCLTHPQVKAAYWDRAGGVCGAANSSLICGRERFSLVLSEERHLSPPRV